MTVKQYADQPGAHATRYFETKCPWCKAVLKIGSREFSDSKYTETICDSCGAQLECEAEYTISGVFVSSSECIENKQSHDWTDWRSHHDDWEYRNCTRCSSWSCRKIETEKEEAK